MDFGLETYPDRVSEAKSHAVLDLTGSGSVYIAQATRFDLNIDAATILVITKGSAAASTSAFLLGIIGDTNLFSDIETTIPAGADMTDGVTQIPVVLKSTRVLERGNIMVATGGSLSSGPTSVLVFVKLGVAGQGN